MWCPKIPPGREPRPDNAVELSDENYEAWQHYRECKAVGEFPSDAIVRRNAAIIRDAEETADKVRNARSGLGVLNTLLALK